MDKDIQLPNIIPWKGDPRLLKYPINGSQGFGVVGVWRVSVGACTLLFSNTFM
jgi:hypothetical protein